MSKHYASAKWNGNLPEGNGTYTLKSSGYQGKVNFKSRFEDGDESSPEELIGAALSACFSMALSNELDQAGAEPKSIETAAEVTLAKTGDSFSITEIALKTKGNVSGIDEDKFREIADKAKENCPVSRALKDVNVTLNAELI